MADFLLTEDNFYILQEAGSSKILFAKLLKAIDSR